MEPVRFTPKCGYEWVNPHVHPRVPDCALNKSRLRELAMALKTDETGPRGARTVLPALDRRAIQSRPGTEVFLNPPQRHSNASILEIDREWEGTPGAGDGGGNMVMLSRFAALRLAGGLAKPKVPLLQGSPMRRYCGASGRWRST